MSSVLQLGLEEKISELTAEVETLKLQLKIADFEKEVLQAEINELRVYQ